MKEISIKFADKRQTKYAKISKAKKFISKIQNHFLNSACNKILLFIFQQNFYKIHK